MNIATTDASVYTDFQGLTQLQGDAKTDPSGALNKVAKQFEAVFIEMMLKSMREANTSDGMFNSDQMKTYQELFDKQISLNLSDQHAMGIADMLVKQLSGVVGHPAPPVGGGVANGQPAGNTQEGAAISGTSGAKGAAGQAFVDKVSFLQTIWPDAQRSAAQIGVDPSVLAAQAALESNWGNGVSASADGRSSYNLFGIKADASWTGPRVTVPTLEYKGGRLVQETAPFRAYGSYAESFADYTRFLESNPRYRDALAKTGDAGEFVAGLQQAGYATDPKYSDKVLSILANPVFGKTVTELKNS